MTFVLQGNGVIKIDERDSVEKVYFQEEENIE